MLNFLINFISKNFIFYIQFVGTIDLTNGVIEIGSNSNSDEIESDSDSGLYVFLPFYEAKNKSSKSKNSLKSCDWSLVIFIKVVTRNSSNGTEVARENSSSGIEPGA